MHLHHRPLDGCSMSLALQSKWLSCHHYYTTLNSPVSDVIVVPLEVSFKGLVVGHIRDATARQFHGLHGGLVQLSSLLQPHLPLQPLQSLGGGRHRLEATAVRCNVQVTKLLQIILEDNMRKHISTFGPGGWAGSVGPEEVNFYLENKLSSFLMFLWHLLPHSFSLEENHFLSINIIIGLSAHVLISLHSLIAFWDLNLSRQNEPSATHFCQLRIRHVFDDVSWECDMDRPARDGRAPSILYANPQN